MFGNLSDRITASFNQLRGKGRLTEADVNATVTEIRRALLEADVALPVVRAFTAAVREKAVDAARSQALNPGQQVVKIVNEELIEVLGGQTREIHWADRGPTIIMLAGLQGAGKTTLAGKLGRWLRDQGKRVLLVASDLQRPNAVTQLSVVAERAGVHVWAPEPGNGVGDPVAVARSGVEHARTSGYDVVVVDTAGRLGVDAEEAEKVAAKAMAGQLTLADFLSQLQQIKKLGSMKKMLGMIPGAAQMREQIENFDEREVDRVEAIVRSMTPAEREDVSILNGSRRARIARGSGTTVTEVNQLVQRFEAAREMMAQMGQMGGGVPGMGALPGRGGKAKQKANARKAQAQRARMKKSARSGNPAKRRQQELEAMLPPSERSAPKGSSFGVAQEAPAPRPTIDDLPDDVKRMLGQL